MSPPGSSRAGKAGLDLDWIAWMADEIGRLLCCEGRPLNSRLEKSRANPRC